MAEIIEGWEEQTFPLVEAAKELKAAAAAIQKMATVGIQSFHEFDRAWREFLHCIDRAWNKTRDEVRGRKRWQHIESEVEKLRKTDPLLRYLIQARNVSEHTIAPLIKEWDPNLKVTPVGGKVRFEWDGWDRPLLPVVNRGTVFNPPRKHLGKPMSHLRRKGVSEPRMVAELAMNFYVGVINRVSTEVYPGGRV
ncbi:MAG: hypothetical protein ACYCZQ_10050 [Burkholderiales bacterium]